jgi:acyl-CoA thioesterase-1
VRYLALGDSFTIGTGTTPDRSFPAVLVSLYRSASPSRAARRVGLRPTPQWGEWELLNPAVNGYTTDDLIREELPLVEAFRPDLITVLIGANDIVAGVREERYRAQLRRVHERIRADAPNAARYALPQPDWSLARAGAIFGDPTRIARTIERFNQVAKEEAERAGAAYVDLFPLMREQMRGGMTAADGLHPSADAYAGWARALAPLLTHAG